LTVGSAVRLRVKATGQVSADGKSITLTKLSPTATK
jgi:hypothetical protein